MTRKPKIADGTRITITLPRADLDALQQRGEVSEQVRKMVRRELTNYTGKLETALDAVRDVRDAENSDNAARIAELEARIVELERAQLERQEARG